MGDGLGASTAQFTLIGDVESCNSIWYIQSESGGWGQAFVDLSRMANMNKAFLERKEDSDGQRSVVESWKDEQTALRQNHLHQGVSDFGAYY